MIRYAVEVTASALTTISSHVRYIAEEALEAANARRWFETVWDAVDSLERWPRRASMAEEDAYVAYEVRQLLVGKHLLLFTIDDERRRVVVLGIRHRHRLPRGDELPPGPPGSPSPG